MSEIASDLPQGHLRALGIAVGLAANPQVLLLDEPFAGMNHDETIEPSKWCVPSATAASPDAGRTRHAGGDADLRSHRRHQFWAEDRGRDAGPDSAGREGRRSLSRRRRRDDRGLAVALLSGTDVELYYDDVFALKGVSIDVDEGETVALIGANGAGKRSILRAITGLRKCAEARCISGSPDRRALPRPSSDWASSWCRKAVGCFRDERARQSDDGRFFAPGRRGGARIAQLACWIAFRASRSA